MIDLTKPIRTKDGREAKYLGELPDGMKGYCLVYRDGSVGSSHFALEQAKAHSGRQNQTGLAIDLSTLTDKNFVRVGK